MFAPRSCASTRTSSERSVTLQEGRFALCALPATGLPDWIQQRDVWAMASLPSQWVIATRTEGVPAESILEDGYRALRLDFSEPSLLDALADTLSATGIDFLLAHSPLGNILLLPESELDAACVAVTRRGVRVVVPA
jgi:hypothetical protein